MARLTQCQDGCQAISLCYQQLCDPGQIPPSEPYCYHLSNKRIHKINGFSSSSLLLNWLKTKSGTALIDWGDGWLEPGSFHCSMGQSLTHGLLMTDKVPSIPHILWQTYFLINECSSWVWNEERDHDHSWSMTKDISKRTEKFRMPPGPANPIGSPVGRKIVRSQLFPKWPANGPGDYYSSLRAAIHVRAAHALQSDERHEAGSTSAAQCMLSELAAN